MLEKISKKSVIIGLTLIVLLFFVLFYFIFKSSNLTNKIVLEKPTVGQILDRAKNFKQTVNDFKVVNYIPEKIDLCQLEKTEIDKQKCFDNIKFNNIIKTKNPEECLGLKTIEIRDDCLLRMITSSSVISSSTPNECVAIIDAGKKAVCIDAEMINMASGEMCDKYFTDEPNENNECKDRILAFNISNSGKKDDIADCEKIKSLEYPVVCLTRSFHEKFNDDCSVVPVKYQDLCYTNKINAYAKTEAECSLIPIEGYKKYCILKLKANGDVAKIMKIDSDGDGFPDGDELFTGTDPYNKDTDGEGLSDYDEMFKYFSNPKVFEDKNKIIAEYNKKESTKIKKDLVTDSDHDGLTDVDELFYGTDPFKMDTNGDGITDGDEIKNKINSVKIDNGNGN